MIQEDYVNFECVKLLKEKGFDIERIESYYCEYDSSDTTHEFNEHEYPLITLQMAMKWLREKHDICIYCFPSSLQEYGMWESGACWIENNVSVIFNNCSHSIYANSYEEAVEAAIMYCLENLI